MGDVTVQTFSSLNKHGLPELEHILNEWFGLNKPDEEIEADDEQ
jgi:GTP-binding protein